MVDNSAITELQRRMQRSEDRLDWLDEHGSRAVTGLQLQVGELIKDVAEMRIELSNVIAKRVGQWIALAAILLPMYGLMITLILRK